MAMRWPAARFGAPKTHVTGLSLISKLVTGTVLKPRRGGPAGAAAALIVGHIKRIKQRFRSHVIHPINGVHRALHVAVRGSVSGGRASRSPCFAPFRHDYPNSDLGASPSAVFVARVRMAGFRPRGLRPYGPRRAGGLRCCRATRAGWRDSDHGWNCHRAKCARLSHTSRTATWAPWRATAGRW